MTDAEARRWTEKRKARLVISNPWELVNADGEPEFEVTVEQVASLPTRADETCVLLGVQNPIGWNGMSYRYLVATGRQLPDISRDLAAGQRVHCNVVGVSEESALTQGLPWGSDSWRGGLAAIADLTLLPVVPG